MMTEAELQAQIQGLSTFLYLEEKARSAKDEAHLRFIITNDTLKLIRYDQLIMIESLHSYHDAKVIAISGVAHIDSNTIYVDWLRKVCKQIIKEKHHPIPTGTQKPFVITINDIDGDLHKGWREWIVGNFIWCPLIDPQKDHFLGALIFVKKTPLQDFESEQMQRLCRVYAHAYAKLSVHKHRRMQLVHHFKTKRNKWIIAAIIILVSILPVRQSALGPAEIVPKDPLVVSSPQDGVIKKVLIKPNAEVKKDTPLFTLDDTTLRNKLEVTQKGLAVLQADLHRATQKAFDDEQSKDQLSILSAKIDEKTAELNYVKDLLGRTEIKADQDGIAVFTNESDWIGKPVVVGERVMTLADPQKIELEISLSVNDAINFTPGANVRLFLNTAPLDAISAKLVRSSYQADVLPNNTLAYKLRAAFLPDLVPPRIGLKGTAKVYGKRVPLIYYLFRRPIAAIRKYTGL